MRGNNILERHDMSKSLNVYSAQFEYKDLCIRLLKIKKEQEKEPSALFRTFDSSFIYNKFSSTIRHKKRKISNEIISGLKGKKDLNIDHFKSHRRNLTEQIYLSDPFPKSTYQTNLRNHSGNKRLKARKRLII